MAMTKATYKRKHLVGGSQFQRVRIHYHQCWMHGTKQAGLVLERRSEGRRLTESNWEWLLEVPSQPQWHTSSNKAKPPNNFQTVTPTGHQIFKYTRPMRAFSSNPPHMEWLEHANISKKKVKYIPVPKAENHSGNTHHLMLAVSILLLSPTAMGAKVEDIFKWDNREKVNKIEEWDKVSLDTQVLYKASKSCWRTHAVKTQRGRWDPGQKKPKPQEAAKGFLV